MSGRQESPLRCPMTGKPLQDVRVIPLGSVTGELVWELHAGRSEEYGWFQAEVISKPPREIFPVRRPGGATRKMIVGGKPVYAFPTIWDSTNRRTEVDMYDPDLWQVDWSRLPARESHEVKAG